MISRLMKNSKSLNFLLILGSLTHRSDPWRIGYYTYNDTLYANLYSYLDLELINAADSVGGVG